MPKKKLTRKLRIVPKEQGTISEGDPKSTHTDGTIAVSRITNIFLDVCEERFPGFTQEILAKGVLDRGRKA